MQIQWNVFILRDTMSSSGSSNSILQMTKIRLWDFETLLFLNTLLQINYGWDYHWHIITILFLVFESFFNQMQIILYNSFTRFFPHNDYSWFLIQILHLYNGFSFSSLFSNNNVLKDSCFSIRCNWICWKGKELNSGNQSMIQLCLSHQN